MNLNSILIRVSGRFQRHYSCVLDERNAPAQLFPHAWNVDILPDGHGQLLILASEESSLFSFLIPVNRARRTDLFLVSLRERIGRFLDVGLFKFTNRTNRRIIGSQNDLLYLANQTLKGAEKPAHADTLRDIEHFLNSTPMSYLNMGSPRDCFAEQLAKLNA